MTMLSILQYPDSGLKRKSISVTNVSNKRIQDIINDMLETLQNTEHCAGLSATQLDIPNPPSITVIAATASGNEPIVLINPQIIHREGKIAFVEACMSIYPSKISAEVKRAEAITLKTMSRDGKQLEIKANDFFAVCIQHELDHLDGILYIDHLSPLKRRMIEKKIKKARIK